MFLSNFADFWFKKITLDFSIILEFNHEKYIFEGQETSFYSNLTEYESKLNNYKHPNKCNEKLDFIIFSCLFVYFNFFF